MAARPWQLAVIAIGVLAVPAWLLVGAADEPRSGLVYAWDTGTGRLFATAVTIPPMPAPSGAEAGVLAHAVIFEGDDEPTVVYLTTLTPAARQLLAGQIVPSREVEAGTLVQVPGDERWVPITSAQGQAILSRTAELAQGRTWRVAVPR